MKSTLIRSALLAARRNLEDGKGHVDHSQDVRDAHLSIYDTLPAEDSRQETIEFAETCDFVDDLLQFAAAVRGEMPTVPTLTPKWTLKKDGSDEV